MIVPEFRRNRAGLDIPVMRFPTILLLVCFIALGGCSEQVLTQPELNLSAQPNATVAPPVLLAVTDDQAGERGAEYAARLRGKIHNAYPRAVEDAAPGTPVLAG